MKVGLGLYRHMLTRDYYAFARQAGCTHVVVHLVDYFKQGTSNPRHNQPTGGKYEPWGMAGDPEKLWTVGELKKPRPRISIPPTGMTFFWTVRAAPNTSRM
jgi:mannonate dehydratase